MKKPLSYVLSIILVFILFANSVQSFADSNCQLYLDIESEENFFKNKYDIDIYFDDTLVGTVQNGKYFTKLMKASVGSHTVTAVSKKNNEIKATQKISFDKDSTFKCKLEHSKTIAFKDVKVTYGLIGHSLKVPEVSDWVLSTATDELKKAGFVNIISEGDKTIWEEANWRVISQSVKSGTITDKNTEIILKCEKFDDYYTRLFVGKKLNEVDSIAEANNIALTYKEYGKSGNINDRVEKLSDKERKLWIVKEAEDASGKDRIAKISLSYIGSPTPAPTPTPTPVPSGYIFTKSNDKDFAEFLSIKNRKDSRIAGYIEKYKGYDVQIDGHIESIQGTKEEYKLIIACGDKGSTKIGPVVVADANLHYFEILYDKRPIDFFEGQNVTVTGTVLDSANESTNGYIPLVIDIDSFKFRDPILTKGTNPVLGITPDSVLEVQIQNKISEITAGETSQLSAVCKPEDASDKTVVWSSSDTSVLDVDENGLITGISPGTAVVTAESSNGFSDSLEIKVIGREITIAVYPKYTVISSNSVGNDWSLYSVVVDRNPVSYGGTVKVHVGDVIKVSMMIEEYDKDSCDYGTYSEEIKVPDIAINRGFNSKGTIYVREDRGRYSGNSAPVSCELNFVRVG